MKEQCILREASDKDLDTVLDIELESFDVTESFDRHIFEIILKAYPELFIVVECEGAIVGFAMGTIEGDLCHLINIAVKPSYRGRGLGEMLVEMFELKCSSLGLSKAVLEVKATNEPAVNLYVKRGFKVMGVIKNYYPDASDALIMEKVLKGLSKQ